MTDATEGAIARVRVVLDVGAIGPKLGADMSAIIAHIDAQAAEIEELKHDLGEYATITNEQAAEITKLRAVASELVGFAESGRVTGTTIADRVRVDALIGKLRDGMKEQP